jgi:hypothetical protein
MDVNDDDGADSEDGKGVDEHQIHHLGVEEETKEADLCAQSGANPMSNGLPHHRRLSGNMTSNTGTLTSSPLVPTKKSFKRHQRTNSGSSVSSFTRLISESYSYGTSPIVTHASEVGPGDGMRDSTGGVVDLWPEAEDDLAGICLDFMPSGRLSLETGDHRAGIPLSGDDQGM